MKEIESGSPASFREMVAICAALKSSPYEIEWGKQTKAPPRKRRSSAA